MQSAYIIGAGNTAFGRHEGRNSLDLIAQAAYAALDEAGLERRDIDGVLCGYATTMPHIMLATVFCEKFGLRPNYAHSLQIGGATGGAMVMLARLLVRAGTCRNVLVVAGENRLSGQSRDASVEALANVGDADYEVPNGATIPAYYALLAARYMRETGTTEADLADLAVLMRAHAAQNPQAHLGAPITREDVLASKPIASPLKLLDCCPISDGAVAVIVSADPGDGPRIVMRGAGQAHLHQHLSAMSNVLDCGAAAAARRAFAEAQLTQADIGYLAIYDSFTITLAMLIEELGFAKRGGAAARVRDGDFDLSSKLPLNTHGGLLSFGHSGVAGGLMHVAETARQLAGRCGTRQVDRQVKPMTHALIHADGGIMSSHVSLILSRED